MPIKKGDIVTILPEFQDPGDDGFVWQAITDEEKGRVTLQTLGTGMGITPTCVVNVDWVRVASNVVDVHGRQVSSAGG